MWYGQIEGTDIVVLDPRFKACFPGHVRVERLWSGARWAEGPAWFAAGRYLIWSDIPNNRMMRFVEPSGEVSVFRERSNNSNGNTVDNQGRLVTCEHLTRRVTRTEIDGSISVIADNWNGKRLNSPNDLVVKSDEFHLVHRSRLRHRYRLRRGSRGSGDRGLSRISSRRQIRRGHYRHYRYGSPERHRLLARREVPLCRRHGRDAQRGRSAPHSPLRDERSQIVGWRDLREVHSGPVRWFSRRSQWPHLDSSAEGVHCYDSDGTLIGKILIPEMVANVAFGGTKLNRLFICGTTSLYSIYVTANGSKLG